MALPPQNNDIQAKSYSFRVVIEPDQFEDDRPAYHVFCPALKQYGASTWGNTEAEALKNIQEVVQMIVEELIEDGVTIPEGPREEVEVFTDPRVSVTV
jgi:predicted RNase H-like HicB family nuclease